MNENGHLLEEGEIRPYHLYTGRQFVHYDERWSMDESREIFDKYTARLTSIDTLYGRIFRILRSYRMRLAASGKDLGDTISSRIAEATETLKLWSDPMSTVGKELGYSVSSRITDLTETLRSVSQPLANSPKELSDTIGIQVHELAEHLSSLADPATIDRQDIAGKVTSSISSLSDLLNQVYDTSTKPNPAS